MLGAALVSAAVLAGGCPVTEANAYRPFHVAELRDNARRPWLTNRRLAISWPTGGTIAARPGHRGVKLHADGSVSTKFGVVGRHARRRIRWKGRRIDGGAGLLRYHYALASTPRGVRFWATRLRFASEGCWRVTGRSSNSRLTFVIAIEIAR